MDLKFRVKIESFKKISKIENAWCNEDYKGLLSLMGLDDGLDAMNISELKEMCLMSLNDFKPEEAAEFVLTHLFNEELTEGKINQLSHQMPEESMWEEYPDYFYHKRLFNAYGLLREAFNGIFSKPTGVEFTFSIAGHDKDDFHVFKESPHASIVRLLSCGLDQSEILNRLCDEQIAGNTFKEAEAIAWELEEVARTDQEVKYRFISSELWFGGFEDVSQFEAYTHADTLGKNKENSTTDKTKSRAAH